MLTGRNDGHAKCIRCGTRRSTHMTIALEPRTRRPQVLAAAATIIGAAVTAVYGAYGDPHPSAEQEHTVPVVIGAAVVIALLVFGLLVPWAARTSKRAAGWG